MAKYPREETLAILTFAEWQGAQHATPAALVPTSEAPMSVTTTLEYPAPQEPTLGPS